MEWGRGPISFFMFVYSVYLRHFVKMTILPHWIKDPKIRIPK